MADTHAKKASDELLEMMNRAIARINTVVHERNKGVRGQENR